MKQFLKTLKGAVVLTVLMAVLSSVIYPAVTTVLAQTVFKEKADGSLIYADGKAVGSEVVGQQWSDPRFFKGRPSSVNYNVYTDEEKADGTYTGVASGTHCCLSAHTGCRYGCRRAEAPPGRRMTVGRNLSISIPRHSIRTFHKMIVGVYGVQFAVIF